MSLSNILANKSNTDNTVANFVQKAFHLLAVLSHQYRLPNMVTSSTGCPMDLSSSSKILKYFKRSFYQNTSDIKMFTVSSGRYISTYLVEHVWLPKIKKRTNKINLLSSSILRRKRGTIDFSEKKNQKLRKNR